jgi:hypothetical protein
VLLDRALDPQVGLSTPNDCKPGATALLMTFLHTPDKGGWDREASGRRPQWKTLEHFGRKWTRLDFDQVHARARTDDCARRGRGWRRDLPHRSARRLLVPEGQDDRARCRYRAGLALFGSGRGQLTIDREVQTGALVD